MDRELKTMFQDVVAAMNQTRAGSILFGSAQREVREPSQCSETRCDQITSKICCRTCGDDGLSGRHWNQRRSHAPLGIDTRPIKVGVFAVCGFLAGLAAVIQTARINSANPNVGVGWELQAIAAVVIGGTSLMGGRGSVIGSFFGVLIIAVLSTGLDQIGAEEYIKRIITGSAIVAAVVLDYYRDRLSSKR